jgi:5-methyltetrahydropteroyltriglutamate--homocysteine methyltransferase
MQQRSTERILTTHAGSLPRPDDLRALLVASQGGRQSDPAAFERACAAAVRQAVAKQRECGIDIICDGEMSKVSYVGYVRDRFDGIHEGAVATGSDINPVLPTSVEFPDIAAHPDFAEARAKSGAGLAVVPVHAGAVSYRDTAPLAADIARLKSAAGDAGMLFMNAASPGVLATFIPTAHYRNEDDYIAALAAAMRTEYAAIHRAGLLLQIDCPDLAMSWHMRHWRAGEAAFLRVAHRNMEVLNEATADIPAEAMRIHICWGNYGGPHTHDLPVAKLFEVLRRTRAQAISFEGANPRHEHEWEDWRQAALPDDKVLIPGVVDSTTNFVEHPRLVAQRIKHYADIVGRERVIAGTDCGFGTFALRHHQVFPSVVWSKLSALSEGARMASAELWGRA